MCCCVPLVKQMLNPMIREGVARFLSQPIICLNNPQMYAVNAIVQPLAIKSEPPQSEILDIVHF